MARWRDVLFCWSDRKFDFGPLLHVQRRNSPAFESSRHRQRGKQLGLALVAWFFPSSVVRHPFHSHKINRTDGDGGTGGTECSSTSVHSPPRVALHTLLDSSKRSKLNLPRPLHRHWNRPSYTVIMGKKKGGKKSSSTKLKQEIADSVTLADVIDDEYLISTQDDQCVEERRFLWKIDHGAREFGTCGMDAAFIPMAPEKKLLGSTKHQGKLVALL